MLREFFHIVFLNALSFLAQELAVRESLEVRQLSGAVSLCTIRRRGRRVEDEFIIFGWGGEHVG